jgi:hypothetical protein
MTVVWASIRFARSQNTPTFHGPVFAHLAFTTFKGGICGKAAAFPAVLEKRKSELDRTGGKNKVIPD